MYSFPVSRRAPFIALLIITLVIAYAPATTRGTATVRLAALSTPSAVSDIFVRISSLELHQEGFPNSTGWSTISQPFPLVDLLSRTNQSLSQTIGSATIHSGRYDTLKIFFTNSTVVISGTRIAVGAPSPLEVNATLLVSPNGVGDLLLVVAFDYAAIFATAPSLTFIVVRISSV
jgi:hypothetical protein